MTENPYGIPEPNRPQTSTPENPYGLPEHHAQTIVRRHENARHAELRFLAPRTIPAGTEVRVNLVTGAIDIRDEQ